jgi:3-oxoacyl-(acyl-carrier-protein) synthase
LITIFKTGDFDYSDVDPSLTKPVRYTINDLMEVASRTSKINVTNKIIHERPEIILSNSFGFGGTNAAIILRSVK